MQLGRNLYPLGPEIKFLWGLDMTQHEPTMQPLQLCKIVCVGAHQPSHKKLAVPFQTKYEDAELVVESGGVIHGFSDFQGFCRLHNAKQVYKAVVFRFVCCQLSRLLASEGGSRAPTKAVVTHFEGRAKEVTLRPRREAFFEGDPL